MSDRQMIGLSGLIAMRRNLDLIANKTTPAFKAGWVQFREFLSDAKEPEVPDLAKRSLVSTLQFTDFTVGGVKATGNFLDVALIDDASFFVVDTPAGPRYTRSGAFTLDGKGKLTTLDGAAVMTSSGQLVVQQRDGPVAISGDGSISTAQGRVAGLRVVRFADRRQLTPEGGGLFSSTTPPIEIPSGKGRVATGVLEMANVGQADEMGRMMAATHAYDVLAKTVFKSEPAEELRKLAGAGEE